MLLLLLLLMMMVQGSGACSHWLSVVMVELRCTDAAKYKTTILAFINALLHGFDDLLDRCRIREQLLAGQCCIDCILFYSNN